MDRLAAQVIATAVLTAALAAVPAAMANPTSDPAPGAASAATASAATASAPAAPTPSRTATPTTPATTAPGSKSSPSPAQPIPCRDARQVGSTSYARWHGIIAFSVKQFYSPSCHAAYGYAYPWLQFRLKRARYDLGLAVFDVTRDAIDGARTFVGGAGGPDFWSSPVPVPAGTCTEGLAHVFFPDTETDTYTARYCR
jgi:hypothetical protein